MKYVNTRRGNGIILMYDICHRSSLEHMRPRMEKIRDIANPATCIMLLGNKIDDEQYRDVTYDVGYELSKELGIHLFFEISVMQGTNVTNAIHAFVLLIGNQFHKDIRNEDCTASIRLHEQTHKQRIERKSCC